MQLPEESDEQFRARISKVEQDEESGRPSFSEPGWTLGRLRDRGSIHSDVWTGTAADLAARRHLAIYPVGGWWKERVKHMRFDQQVRYALVVSVHAPDAEVDIYTPVAVMVGVEVEV